MDVVPGVCARALRFCWREGFSLFDWSSTSSWSLVLTMGDLLLEGEWDCDELNGLSPMLSESRKLSVYMNDHVSQMRLLRL